MENISYCAVVLTEASRIKLLDEITVMHPEVIAHHMTINMGPLLEKRQLLGKEVSLRVVGETHDEKVQAVKVEQLGLQPTTKNHIPHITISVNRKNGGKPFQSNNLKNWFSLESFEITGIVSEIPNKL